PDPARRYSSAAALREDVERHLRDEPLKYARDVNVPERLRKWTRRNPRLPFVVSVAAACLIALFAGVAWDRHREASPAEQARVERVGFDEDLQLTRFYLGTGREDAEHRRTGKEIALRALRRYRVRDDPQWASRWLFTSLPKSEQRATREEVGELLFFLA